MEASNDFRSSIVEELKQRVYTVSDDIRIVEGTGGFWGKWGKTLPVVHFFENASISIIDRPGLYRVNWDIQLEYVRRISMPGNKIFTEGRLFLKELKDAIEIDKRFTDRTTGNDLVLEYYRTADEIVEVSPSVVNAASVYTFVFFEEFGVTDNVPNCKGH